MMVLSSPILLVIFFLLDKSVVHRSELKSVTIIGNLSIFPCTSVGFNSHNLMLCCQVQTL
jgi:hypothetical protein